MDWINAQLNRFRQTHRPQPLPGGYPSSPPPQTPWYSTVMDGFNYFIILPVSILLRILLAILSLLFKTIYNIDGSRDYALHGSETTASSALVNDPIRRAEQFVMEQEECLPPTHYQRSGSGVDHLPPFFQGSYSQALYMANSRAKFLFVYLTNPHTEGSKSLFEKVIINPSFIKIFANNEKTLIWGGNVAHAEAYQLATNLNITKFPMLGLLCLARTTKMTPEGPRKEVARISLILKIQGGIRDSVDVDNLIQSKFVKKMMRYEPELALIRAELREKYELDVMLRRQEEDYQRSLEQDRIKKRQKEDEELLVKYLKWRQPYFLQLIAGNESSPTLRIAFKFEDGYRVTICFPQDSSIEDLFVYVELYTRGMLNSQYEVTISDEVAQSMFNKRPRNYKSRLTSTVPPRPSLNDLPLSTRIKDVEFITPSGLLMVESI